MSSLIICDIQPEYTQRSNRRFQINHFVAYLNRVATRYHHVNYFYNGYETLGMITEDALQMWLFDYGLSDKAFERIRFCDKGYGSMRDAIDNNVPDESIVKVIRMMRDAGIWDCSFLTEEQHQALLYGNDIHWNESFDIIKTQKAITFVGGGRNECLLELMLGAKAFNVPYKLNEKFVY